MDKHLLSTVLALTREPVCMKVSGTKFNITICNEGDEYIFDDNTMSYLEIRDFLEALSGDILTITINEEFIGRPEDILDIGLFENKEYGKMAL